jgi:cellulose synthase/poly-beta-1,6-N-acetylglucosamine synthase-like glycosyltransferase
VRAGERPGGGTALGARVQARELEAAAGDGLPIEVAFLADHGVAPAELRQAGRIARRIGAAPSRHVLASGLVTEEAFYRALAAELRLRFLSEPPPLEPGGEVAAILRQGMARVRAREASPVRFVLAPPAGPALRHVLAARIRGRDEIVMVPPSALAAELRRVNAAALTRAAAWQDEAGLQRFSARTGSNRLQRRALLALVGTVLAGGLQAPLSTMAALALGLAPLFLGAVLLRLAAAMEPAACDLWQLGWQIDDSRLPVYTVAVPLFRESATLDQLIGALAALDYPAAKLEILILVEEIDWSTRRALAARDLPPFMQVIVVPRGLPQTKPRALNIALAEARGALFAIFDAEDIPDPRQLRMAAARFLRSPPELVCLQAHLVIDNTEDGWLPGCFALEYAGLFDVLNPGLLHSGLPIMLGGTSNHFRTEALRQVGGWDAWNVTEDADIGFRLIRAGGHIADLPSRTLEEAPADPGVWLNQRRRWLKGYLQTAISHLQQPDRLLREAGAGNALTFLVLTLGTLVATLGYPFFIAAMLARWHALLTPESAADVIFSGFSLGLAASGLIVMLLLPAIGAWRRGAIGLWRWLPWLPVYYLFTSLAAWLALHEYVHRRFAWNKTPHGLARSSRYRSRARGAK